MKRVIECFASKDSKVLSRIIIDNIERMIENDGSRYPGAKSNNG